jgi:predicted DNA-binding transcriptional regulator YafY
MNRLDRALGILLLLRGGQTLSAAELGRRFEVSPRTIYRDIEILCAVGVPIYAEMGRDGGFRLVEGYFLPPVMFSVGEAVSLLLGLTLLRSLRARPFAAELETGEQKLIAAVPDRLRAMLAHVQQIIGFETMPGDIFHPERAQPQPQAGDQAAVLDEGAVVGSFLQAVLDHKAVALDYRSPYAGSSTHVSVSPCGVLWDRDRWYLVGQRAGRAEEPRFWRADRVLAIAPEPQPAERDPAFDIGGLLGHAWLRSAIVRWSEMAPVRIRLTRQQAERLKQDWYYRHARFDDHAGDQVVITFGESERANVLELLRWLGPGAELLEPRAWRPALRDELAMMLAAYGGDEVVSTDD